MPLSIVDIMNFTNYFSVLSQNYKIIYWINEEKNRIEIVDIFDTRQNPLKIKREK